MKWRDIIWQAKVIDHREDPHNLNAETFRMEVKSTVFCPQTNVINEANWTGTNDPDIIRDAPAPCLSCLDKQVLDNPLI